MSDLDRLAARIDELEIRVAHQDRTIEELNATITAQWKQMDMLEQRIARLKDQVSDVENGPGFTAPAEPPPPHY